MFDPRFQLLKPLLRASPHRPVPGAPQRSARPPGEADHRRGMWVA
jgi:hypothetical protein